MHLSKSELKIYKKNELKNKFKSKNKFYYNNFKLDTKLIIHKSNQIYKEKHDVKFN